jgi:hypothetical protein
MSWSPWWRLGVVACALAGGCSEGRAPAESGTFEQSARSGAAGGGFDGWAAIDEGTGSPIDLRQLDDEDHIVHGPDTAVPLAPEDGGVIDTTPTPEAPATPPQSSAPDAAVPEPDAAVPPEPEPPGGISLGLCDLLGSLLCAEGLECIDGVCTQPLSCAAEASCELACSQPSRCAAGCDDANKCKVDCAMATSCAVSCVGANNCEPRCRGGSDCEIDCRDANNCDHVVCEGDAQCLVRCGEDTNCKIERCKEPRRCSGNILVCNRECPPGSVDEED